MNLRVKLKQSTKEASLAHLNHHKAYKTMLS